MTQIMSVRDEVLTKMATTIGDPRWDVHCSTEFDVAETVLDELLDQLERMADQWVLETGGVIAKRASPPHPGLNGPQVSGSTVPPITELIEALRWHQEVMV